MQQPVVVKNMRTTTTHPNETTNNPTILERSTMWLTITTDDGAAPRIQHVATDEFVIGRELTADLVIDDEKASRQQCRLTRQENGDLELLDLGSTNGTRVNGMRASGPVALHGGEQIRIGRHTILVSRTDPSAVGGTLIDTTASMIGPSYAAQGGGLAAPVATPSAPLQSPVPAPAFGQPVGALPNYASTAPKPKNKALIGGLAGGAGVVVIGLIVAAVSVGGSSKDLSTAKIVEISRPKTVSVESDISGALQGRGTGWVLDAKQGLIVTNHHVVNAGTNFTVGLDGSKRPATIVGSNPCEDLSVLKVNDIGGLVNMELSSQAQMKQGDKVVALGYPGNAGPKPELQVTSGIVSTVKSQFTARALSVPKFTNIVQTDAAINPGNSGGPLLDTRGRLVGVNSAGDDSKENQAFAIGVDKVKEVTDMLRDGGSRGWTGLDLIFPSSEEDFTDFDLPVIKGGIVAHAAVPLTPAANIGLGRSQFVILGINDQEMDGTLQGYCAVTSTLKAGDRAKFTVTLDGEKQQDVMIKFA
jgi:S1-C subfamily serine protease